ncbi:relaxase/mobilization nuclease domain-containing protein [Mesorhizobium sp. YIM 152430]|uniref:relaxase/mobilization nuclease domain-containing protein n=1 Tax=Mesorhizobium sp. YIM 152430 TaxID=3031761 RepID=UPI0023DC8278|nr:relaxase/mobilization nuclease domain-containing protein [Mesorhizobium sp. YIM 152430]MDF1600939.1 relaxase/mobilization nuclease domain-containing protein [Mesorhizobium sp. YIM 152430]
MIPKASQRAGGQDLATHLLNAHDNEYIELADVRGAVASDLHGAFAEWEAIAQSLTKCRNYLYSLSVNPDLGQGQLSREQYLDYIARVEKAMGLDDQPRAVVFHIKNGREHCHVVWSRIDDRAGKAVHLAFDREKLMMVTREFARDHGLKLPDGYERGGDDRKRKSLYETQQERSSGITKEQRMAAVTEAWKRSDSPRAFVRALEEMGYVLATGKRPYVLVDRYGDMNALPKLIDDKSVRTKDIRAFLEKDFPPDSLPTVEEAKALAAEHRKAREAFARSQRDGRKLEALKAKQAERRAEVETAQVKMLERHRHERAALVERQLGERRALKARYLAEVRQVKEARAAHRPTGLAAFLGRVTGVSYVIGKLHKHRDAQRHAAFVAEKAALAERQERAARDLKHRHDLQALDQARAVRALDQIEKRELRSFETAQRKEERIKERAGREHGPELGLELKPRGRRAVPHKAKNRYVKRALEQAAAPQIKPKLKATFDRAADGKGDGRQEGRGESGGPQLRRTRTRRPHVERRQEPVEVQAQAPARTFVQPHWTELPLSEKFLRAARDRDDVGRGGEDTRGVRISRSERPGERDARKKGRDGDFERER